MMQLAVAARSVAVDRGDWSALSSARDEIGNEAVVTVRQYRGDGVYVTQRAPATVQRRGNNPAVVSFDWRSARLSVPEGGLVEVEVTIPTTAGRVLSYTEVVSAAGTVTVSVPFLRLGDASRVAWPAVGTLVPVTGFFSLLPPGQISRAGVEELPRQVGAPQGAVLTVRDANSGAQLVRETVWSTPGIRAGQQLSFDREVVLDEGRAVTYTFEVRTADGRGWRRSGETTVWTTQLAPDGGFAPAVLFVME